MLHVLLMFAAYKFASEKLHFQQKNTALAKVYPFAGAVMIYVCGLVSVCA